jgi:hypothetical protein
MSCDQVRYAATVESTLHNTRSVELPAAHVNVTVDDMKRLSFSHPGLINGEVVWPPAEPLVRDARDSYYSSAEERWRAQSDYT